jgi:glycosyltransferase involved in cell wall biosynthesis
LSAAIREPQIVSLTPSRPKVSIGVPVYNGERFLSRALESLAAQTYPDLEIVISDNGSTDGTERICRAFAARDPRVSYHRHDVTRGLVWNHRRALALARGEYFMFAPHDDWFSPDYVDRCVEVLDARPDVAYVHCETILVDEEGTEIGREIARQRLDDPSPTTRFWDVLVVRGGINWYGMTRRALFGKIAPYKPLPRGERIVLAELALWGPFHLLDGDLYWRRLHSGQLTSLRVDRRAETLALDPSKEGGWRNSIPVLLAEYVLAYAEAVTRAPLSLREHILGIGRVARWALAHVPGFGLRDERTHYVDVRRTGTGRLPDGREVVGY